MTDLPPPLPPPLPPLLRDRLARLGPVRAVRSLAGGRGGRTVAVDHGDLTSVVHLRRDVGSLVREAEATARAHAAGVGPEVLDVVPEDVALVTRWVPGEVLTDADLHDPARLARVAVAVRALHAAPHAGLARYDPVAWRAEYLARAARTAATRAVAVDDEVVAAVRRGTDVLVERLVAEPAPTVLVHADLVAANLVGRTGPVVLLDLEYAGAGEAAFDLGNLVAGAELDDAAVAALVRAYADGVDRAEVDALLARVRAWAEVARHAWFVWVALGEDLGPARARWTAWAARTRGRWASGQGPDAPE